MSYKLVFAAMLLIAAFSFSSNSVAFDWEEKKEKTIQIYERQLKKVNEVHDELVTASSIALCLTLIIAFLGIIIGVFQRFSHKIFKIVVVILGLLVAIFTAINNAIFEVNHLGFNKAANQVNIISDKLDRRIGQMQIAEDEEEMNIHKEDLRKIITSYDNLCPSLPRIKHVSFIAKAFAHETPRWMKEDLKDKRFLFNSGVPK